MPGRESRFQALIQSCFTPPVTRELSAREIAHHRWLNLVGALFSLFGTASLALGAAIYVRMAWSLAWAMPGLLLMAAGGLFVVFARIEAENRREGRIPLDDFSGDDEPLHVSAR